MTVAELVKALRAMPQHMDVTTWDRESDEYLPIVQVVLEDGCTSVELLTSEVETMDASAEEEP